MYIQAYLQGITMLYELYSNIMLKLCYPKLWLAAPQRCDVNGILIAIDVHVAFTNCPDQVPCPIAVV